MCLRTNVSGHKRTRFCRYDCGHAFITCQGTNVSGHKHVWAQTCVGTNVSGHKCVWAQTCLGTNACGHKLVSGHKRVWVQSVWAQSCELKYVWAQTCGLRICSLLINSLHSAADNRYSFLYKNTVISLVIECDVIIDVKWIA